MKCKVLEVGFGMCWISVTLTIQDTEELFVENYRVCVDQTIGQNHFHFFDGDEYYQLIGNVNHSDDDIKQAFFVEMTKLGIYDVHCKGQQLDITNEVNKLQLGSDSGDFWSQSSFDLCNSRKCGGKCF